MSGQRIRNIFRGATEEEVIMAKKYDITVNYSNHRIPRATFTNCDRYWTWGNRFQIEMGENSVIIPMFNVTKIVIVKREVK